MKSSIQREAQPSEGRKHLSPEAEYRSRLSWFLGVSDPVAIDPDALTYEPFFGLRDKPFSLAADPRFFFSESGHGTAFNTLAAGIKRREGILVLTGEVGTGKTTLCQAVLQSLDRKTFAAFVSDPFLSREDLLKTLLVDFSVVSAEEMRRGALRGASRADLAYPLYDFLGSLVPLKAFAVVIIDEAQNLTPDLLEEIRILSDLERGGQKLLQVFLVGQPELESRLADQAMRQLSQRVAIRSELPPLSVNEVRLYVAHRLTVAGNDGRVRFTDAAIDEVHAASAGIPRVVNLVCDRALTHAAGLEKFNVEADSVRWARADLKLPIAPPPALALVHSQPDRAPRPEIAVTDAAAVESAIPAPDSLVHILSGLNFDTSSKPAIEPSPDGATVEAAPAMPADPHRATAGGLGVRFLLAVIGATLLLIAAFAAYRSATPPRGQAAPGAIEQPVAPPPAAAQPQETVKAAETAPAKPAPPPDQTSGVQHPVPSTQHPAPGASAPTRLAILVATFLTNERTAKSLQELRSAGLTAYSVDVPLRDGGRGLAVYVGPYDDRAAAERDLGRTRELPGYDSARLVSVKPAARP